MEYFAIMMTTIAIFTGVFGYSTKMDKAETQPFTKNAEQGVNMFNSFGQLVKNPHLFKCSVLMLVGSIVFGAITVFIPLYAEQVKNGNAGIFLMIIAVTVVFSRFSLRKKIPSDGKWHSSFIMGTMLLLAMGAQCVSFATTGGAVFFYAGAMLMGIAQALIYPTLTTYLSFVLPQMNRNVLLGLFIAMADLGVSLGGVIMGPMADIFSYSSMYIICAILGTAMIIFAYDRRKIFVG
jgi:MFS family permease